MVIDDALILYVAEEGWLDESADVASLDHSTLCFHKTHVPHSCIYTLQSWLSVQIYRLVRFLRCPILPCHLFEGPFPLL